MRTGETLEGGVPELRRQLKRVGGSAFAAWEEEVATPFVPPTAKARADSLRDMKAAMEEMNRTGR